EIDNTLDVFEVKRPLISTRNWNGEIHTTCIFAADLNRTACYGAHVCRIVVTRRRADLASVSVADTKTNPGIARVCARGTPRRAEEDTHGLAFTFSRCCTLRRGDHVRLPIRA